MAFSESSSAVPADNITISDASGKLSLAEKIDYKINYGLIDTYGYTLMPMTKGQDLIYYFAIDGNSNFYTFETVVGTFTPQVNATIQPLDCWLLSTVNGVSLTKNIYVPASNLKIFVKGTRNNDKGKLEILIGGVSKAFIDWYGAAASNLVLNAALANTTAGFKDITFKINGKNASSSGYGSQIQEILIESA